MIERANTPSRRTALAPASLLAVAVLLALAPAAPAAPVLSDLVSDPPGASRAPEIYSDALGSRLLLRMDGYVHNRGPGALEIRGSGPVNSAIVGAPARL